MEKSEVNRLFLFGLCVLFSSTSFGDEQMEGTSQKVCEVLSGEWEEHIKDCTRGDLLAVHYHDGGRHNYVSLIARVCDQEKQITALGTRGQEGTTYSICTFTGSVLPVISKK